MRKLTEIKQDRALLLAFAVLAIVAVAPIAVLAIVGDLDSPSDTRLAAVLTFTGVLVTALTSVIGILSRRRSEERLRLEAAMHAGEIFNPSSSGPPHPAAAAAGLLALTRLEGADLAVAILVDVWDATRSQRATSDDTYEDLPVNDDVNSRNCVSNETAILVLDAALQADAPAQLVAAEVLCRNAKGLDICQSLHWPPTLDQHWNPQFGMRTKILLVEALVNMARAHPVTLTSLERLTTRLYGIAIGDPDGYVKGCLGILLCPLVDALKSVGVPCLMFGKGEIPLDDIETEARRYPQIHKDWVFVRLADKYGEALRVWTRECDEVWAKASDEGEPVPGSLGAAAGFGAGRA
jgi:hypothetical protein